MPTGRADYATIHELPEPLRGMVLEAFAASFRASASGRLRTDPQTCWTIGCVLMLLALAVSLSTIAHPLTAAPETKPSDARPPSSYGAIPRGDEAE